MIRRRALPALLLAPVAARAQALLPGRALLLVPGPEAGAQARWAARVIQALAQGAGTAVALESHVLGGPDGVTAANRFATEAASDGRLLLVLAGSALQARLSGDPRAKFDPSPWLPICATEAGLVLAGRGPRPAVHAGAPLRVAVGAPEGHGPLALLALDLLRLRAVALAGPPAPLWQDGSADAVLVPGPELPARLAALGAEPWCVLSPGRDAELPETPTLGELAAGAPRALLAAALASAAAARLQAALMLPALTPADQVALWRSAAARWLEDEARSPANGRPLPGAEAGALTAATLPPPEVVLAWRDWLLRRLGWQGQ